MDTLHASGPKGPSRRAFLSAAAVTAVAVPIVVQAAPARAAPAGLRSAQNTGKFDPALRALIKQIDPDRIQATILRLTQFGTRHTASTQTDPMRGIGAATAWVTQQMQAIAATSGGTMTVQQPSFVQPVSSRIPVPTTITNVIATLHGTASPERFYVVTGHLDSRVTDVLDFTSDAPGADDDASGVACVLELARLFATHQFPGTIVFATVAGEEEGLYGSSFMAQQMKAAGNDVQGMFSNDIIGASQAFDGNKPDPFTVRMFLEGIPTNVTSNQIALLQSVGGENDGLSRQLGRFANSVAPFNLTGMHIRLIWRRNRYLRASEPRFLPGPGISGGQVHRAAGELQPRAPEHPGGQRPAARRPDPVRGLRLRRPSDRGERRRLMGPGRLAQHSQECADPHDAARHLLRHQPHHDELESQPRNQPDGI